MKVSEEGSDSGSSPGSLWKTNSGLVYLAIVTAIPLALVSLFIGLDPPFALFLEVMFLVAAYFVHRWRAKRRPETEVGAGHITRTGALAAVLVFVVIQAVPYGRSHSNGAVTGEPTWPDATTRALTVRACFDCHSNKVVYPWYSNVAPMSWLVQNHVDDGRNAVNFSAIKSGGRYGRVSRVVANGSMPPAYFTRFGLHSMAKLSKAEIAQLVAGLKKIPEFSGGG